MNLKELKKLKEVKYKIVSANCCDKCKWRDGKIYKMRLARIGANYPPFEENCKCKIEMIKE